MTIHHTGPLAHDWDFLTNFCRGCGRSRLDQAESPKDCAAAPNVIAISHIISARRLRELTQGIPCLAQGPIA